MWIFTNRAFISVVAHRDQAGKYLARARIRGDLETLFPGCDVIELSSADYRYRTVIDFADLTRAVVESLAQIDYSNFKNSIQPGDDDRHNAYLQVWGVMKRHQDRHAGADDDELDAQFPFWPTEEYG